MACSEVAAFLQIAGAHYISNIISPLSKQFRVCCSATALCRDPKGGMAQYSYPKYALDMHVLMVRAY